MTKIYKTLLSIIIFLMPVLILTAFMNKNFDLKNLIFGLNELSIVEDFTELKDTLRFSQYDFSWSWDSVEEIFAIILDVIKLVFELLIVDPLVLIIEVFNLLFV